MDSRKSGMKMVLENLKRYRYGGAGMAESNRKNINIHL